MGRMTAESRDGKRSGSSNKELHMLYAIMLISVSAVFASTVLIHFQDSSPNNGLHNLAKGDFSSLIGVPITGNAIAISEANILNTTIGVCIQNLTAGWNSFSSYCVVPNGTLSDELAYVYQDYTKIYYYNAFDSANPWKAYVPGLPSWVVPSLTKMDDLKGYIIYMKRNQTLVVNGSVASPRTVPYNKGYSLVGFPHTGALNASSAFSNSTGGIIAVYYHNSSVANNANLSPLNIGYISYTLSSGTGALQIIKPGMGLWINASSNGGWVLS